MLKAVLGFLFGRQTNIFNKKGRVQHDLGQQKWEAWDNRLKANPNYDWRHHKGITHQDANAKPPKQSATP